LQAKEKATESVDKQSMETEFGVNKLLFEEER
jgi:hypothetical protein